MEIKQLIKQIEGDKVKFILLQFSDIYGTAKSLTIPATKLESALEYGTWIDGSSIEGFARIAESDMFLKPDLDTYAVLPWLESEDGNTARFICDVYDPDGTPFAGGPRNILKRVLLEAEEMGYKYMTGPELEFFLFRRDEKTQPLPHDHGNYFDMTTDQAYAVRRDMTVTLEKMGIEVEATHHEVALGQHEICFRYSDALASADKTATMRVAIKAVAQKHDLHATFMPKPIGGINGSGMHVHQSLTDKETGKNLFFDEKDKYNLSPIAYNFIAGQLRHVKGMSAILSPTVNSYKRLVPGYEAPVYISWARINRSALIRVPRASSGKTEATRIELRNPDPSCNIYLAFAVMLKAGLDGIKNNLSAPAPVEEDVYSLSSQELLDKKIDTLPESLRDALKAMKENKLVQEALGQHTYERFLAAKSQEWRDYARQVTDWEVKQYLEKY